MLSLLATLALACTEPDGGTCAQEVTAGPFNASQVWPGGAGTGMYTTRLWQSPTSPGTACAMMTTYVGVCSSFARSPLLSGGNGGSLGLQNGGHRQVLWTDFSDFSPDEDDFGELGTVGTRASSGAPNGTPYRWKRVTAYEVVTPPRALTCSPQSDGGCFADAAPRGSTVRFACPGPGICEWVPGVEYLDNTWFDVLDGMRACVMNVTEYPLLVRDADGAVELGGDADWLGGKYASLCLERVGDRWVEKSRSAP